MFIRHCYPLAFHIFDYRVLFTFLCKQHPYLLYTLLNISVLLFSLVLVPNESIGSEMPEALPDKEAPLLVYCRSGRRSKDAAEKLLALGYQSVYDFGGVIDWPYELVKEG